MVERVRGLRWESRAAAVGGLVRILPASVGLLRDRTSAAGRCGRTSPLRQAITSTHCGLRCADSARTVRVLEHGRRNCVTVGTLQHYAN